MPLSTHKNVVFSQWESLTDTKLFCSSCSTSSTLMLSNLGDRQHPWKMMNYFPLTFSHFKGHPCPWKMIYLKPCHCFARNVLLCAVLCCSVIWCACTLNTKQKSDWHGRKCLPSLLSFLKTLTLSMTFSSSPSDAVNRSKRTEMSSLLRYM